MKIDERLLAYKPISVTLNFDWEKMSYDERVLARHNYIEEQKKKDPNYVGYDFIEHFSSLYAGSIKGKRESKQIVDFTKLINTLGQTVSFARNKVYISFDNEVGKYRSIYTAIKNIPRRFRVNRVVACTFIPIPDRLKEIREYLVVNHKNDIKSCNLRSNLEWCTQQENVIKAVETSAISSSSFKFTITRPGDYFGKEYYFTGRSSLIEHGFDYTGVNRFIVKGRTYLCGTWEKLSKEELKNKQLGMTKDVIDYIRDPKYGFASTYAGVGTIISEGPCKDEQFVIYGRVQSEELGFDSARISACVLGKSAHHKGCTWIKMTREEAVDIPIGLTDQQKKHIFENKPVIK